MIIIIPFIFHIHINYKKITTCLTYRLSMQTHRASRTKADIGTIQTDETPSPEPQRVSIVVHPFPLWHCHGLLLPSPASVEDFLPRSSRQSWWFLVDFPTPSIIRTKGARSRLISSRWENVCFIIEK